MYIFEISYLEFIKKTSISKKHTLVHMAMLRNIQGYVNIKLIDKIL